MGARQRDGSKVPRIVDSCASCLAWGLTYAQGLCLSCYNFIAPERDHRLGCCQGCARTQPLKTGYCRLCWHQAKLDRAVLATDARSAVVLAPYLANIRYHQLFLTVSAKVVPPPRTAPRRWGERGRPLKPPPEPAARPVADWIQPALFDIDRRDYHRQALDLRRVAIPDNPWLAWALHLAHTTAEERGWHRDSRKAVQRLLVKLLAAHIDGDQIRASDLHRVAVPGYVDFDDAAEILRTMGVLTDDRPDLTEQWLHDKTADLAGPIATDVRDWFTVLRQGGPRSAPRTPGSAQAYLRVLLPALNQWSERYTHLREVTAEDTSHVLTQQTGRHRDATLTAMRSLFTWAARNKRIFRNPAKGLRGAAKTLKIWQPLDDTAIAAAVRAATTPQSRVFLALAAIHGARPGQIRDLKLDDLDLPARRLTIAGLTRPLDDLTHRVLTDWLEHRHTRWPVTANHHLLISEASAKRHGPVNATYVMNLRQVGLTFESLRIDRRLEEALTNGGDPALFLAVFGGSDATAVRYAVNARILLEEAHHAARPGSSPQTPAPRPDIGTEAS